MLILHTTSHQRALCSMETAYGTTGNSNEECREQIILEAIRMSKLTKADNTCFPKLWDIIPSHEEHNHQGCCHEEERECEDWIYLTDNLIHRHHSGYDIVCEDKHYPKHTVVKHACEDVGRTLYEYRAYKSEKQYSKDEHHVLNAFAEVFSYEFRKSGTVITDAEHTA